jgi:carnitine-CoA ligase
MTPDALTRPFLNDQKIWQNLCAELKAVCATHADNPAITVPGRRPGEQVTYRQFFDLVVGAATLLYEEGCRSGDRLLLCLDNQLELIVCAFACPYLGMTAVVVNNKLCHEELNQLIHDSQPACIVTNPVYAEVFGVLLQSVAHSIIFASDIGSGRAGGSGLRTLCPAGSDSLPMVSVDAIDPAFIFYTSGTTATPKGVLITHAHACWAVQQNIAHLGVDQRDVTYLFAPLYHVMAFSYQMLTTLLSGGNIVMRKVFNASRFWDDSLNYRCTWTAVLPHVCNALGVFPVAEKHFYRFWGFGSKNLAVEAMFGVNTVGWWGMTELFAIGSLTDLNDPMVPDFSVGRLARGYESRLVDVRAGGGPFDAEINGELQVKGDRGRTIFLGYFNDQQETGHAFTPDGWFITGDRFFQDRERTLFFDVRLKDIIRVAGENISTAEVEFTVYRTGFVKEVAVVAREDRLLGEVPVACVRLNESGMADPEHARSAIMAACKERLADFKQPRDIVVLSDFPRAELGKIAKKRLKDQIRAASVVDPSQGHSDAL